VTLTKLPPSFREKIWGSHRLEPWFPNSDKKIGEVWFQDSADHPLLIKFIFTTEKLSVQVHPEDEYARTRHNSRGKTEMWHILAAEPGAKIAAGFRESLSTERLRDASKSGEIEQLLAWHEARPGDTFFIPAGTVHAIGPGLVLCEIQQNSDITYRLYDYGRARELHLDAAAEVSRMEPHPGAVSAEGEVLAACDYFVTRRMAVEDSRTIHSGFLVVLEGDGEIENARIRAGEVWRFESPEPVEVRGNVIFLHVSCAY
jgi:mannose-6-phosphate isomerase